MPCILHHVTPQPQDEQRVKQRVVQGLTEDACVDAAHDITAAAVAAMCMELARELYFNCRWAGDVATSIMISAALASSGCPLPPSNQAITYTGPLLNPQQSNHKLPFTSIMKNQTTNSFDMHQQPSQRRWRHRQTLPMFCAQFRKLRAETAGASRFTRCTQLPHAVSYV